MQGFYEFFAGGGMARLGLGENWYCLFANELCEKKAEAYRLNFGPSQELRVEDVAKLTAGDLPGCATLAWASFPCQDLSLAGNGKGLNGARSGSFHAFWELIQALNADGRGVPIVVLENVPGAITSNAGQDFRRILEIVTAAGYRVGPVVLDAARFVPQSRARLFIVAVKRDVPLPPPLTQGESSVAWHSNALLTAYRNLPESLKELWVWWRLPEPPRMTAGITELIEVEAQELPWHTAEETQQLLSLMSRTNREKVRKAQAYGKPIAGTIYKRIRTGEDGIRMQRAEVRFDQISGCLRTPTGGSSRQLIIVVNGNSIRSRLLSPREAARLMGVPESYQLPEKYNEAYHLMGDGLAVPVVRWLEQHLLSPLSQLVHQHAIKVA
ncbi:MAG TPA: DNA cytosine methyltransferase [Bryobacteraceae bacterium]|nr:DNA cytosine methyltransferase [Bryobacteraceae bacterium]